ncbi:CopG family transcriptional regulator [Nocardia macrotermitis]|uniref:Antitoxin MazE6 n=1 Tax=Nocardia macrotermitis TaxID=2585198 RepID=A0A7K0D2F8_9NOCA|nr:CopG family transcriptional regulator [Nocardia macrotermitis]MQY19910.1 Antitoxin MazE6 [Nocardia macrotermitis]
MKTAISVPDDTYAKIERTVHSLGVTRSEFYVHAAQYYIAHLEETTLTSEIDAALDLISGTDDSNAAAASAGRRLLAESDEW